ncbi:hypothetical protein GCM10009839_51810 [Catenulispora yoronensis]|uniref:Esterase n=1 Tax=Catenulispora yoronensis TaxID=450799 RepID=A0ABN2UT97_9ACTN
MRSSLRAGSSSGAMAPLQHCSRVWTGGCHGFDVLFPDARISAAARRTRTDWLARLLTQSPNT